MAWQNDSKNSTRIKWEKQRKNEWGWLCQSPSLYYSWSDIRVRNARYVWWLDALAMWGGDDGRVSKFEWINVAQRHISIVDLWDKCTQKGRLQSEFRREGIRPEEQVAPVCEQSEQPRSNTNRGKPFLDLHIFLKIKDLKKTFQRDETLHKISVSTTHLSLFIEYALF